MSIHSNPPIKVWSNGSDQIRISLIFISAFAMSIFTSPPDSRFSDTRWLLSYVSPAGYSPWPIRPSTHDLGQTAHRGFGDFDVTMYMPLGFPIPEFPSFSPNRLHNGPYDHYIWPQANPVGATEFLIHQCIHPEISRSAKSRRVSAPGWPWFSWPLPVTASLSSTAGIH